MRASALSCFLLLLLTATGLASAQDIHEHRGEITIDVLWGSGIAAAVDVAPADGTIDHLYVPRGGPEVPGTSGRNSEIREDPR